jgi:cell division septation protein DedD
VTKYLKIIFCLFIGFFLTIYGISSYKNRNHEMLVKSLSPTKVNLGNESKSHEHETQPVFYTSVGGSPAVEHDSTISTAKTTRYTIEIATLKSQSEAENLLLGLKAKKIDAFYTPTRRGSDVIYHIRIGLFSSAIDAEKKLNKISSTSRINGEVKKLQ